MLFVCYPRCTTCQKAQRFLEEHQLPFETRHIANENPTLEELRRWHALSGLPLKRFFNTSGLRYKELNLKERLPQMTDEEQREEYLGWKEYSRKNTPPLCPGMDAVIRRQKEEGGLICVASLSTKEIIDRDFMHHFGFLPDAVYDYDLPPHQRKPNPYALEEIMTRFGLKPEELLMVDDMLTGYHMAQTCGVPFACAGWSHPDAAISDPMRRDCKIYLDTISELEKLLFGEKTT